MPLSLIGLWPQGGRPLCRSLHGPNSAHCPVMGVLAKLDVGRSRVEILSLWRSPLDRVALTEATALCERQPRCVISYDEDFHMMTIYNYGYYISQPLATPSTALTAMFGAMANATPIGGRAFIPQQSFSVDATSSGFSVPDQCDIDGSGGGGALGSTSGSAFFHFVITPTGPGSSWFFNCVDPAGGEGHTSGGMYFRSLAFEWGETSETADTCIRADVWNVRAINCTFTNCPIAFNAKDLSCTLEQCTIDYNVSAAQGPNNTKAVILAGTQDGVIGPGQFAQTSQASGGATGCTCISIESAEHPLVSGMQILEWTTGVDFSQADGTRFAHVTNCEIECWQTAVNIQLPASATDTVAGIKVTSCALTKASDSTDANPIVRVDSNGNSQLLLNDIALIDCTVYNMAQAPLLSTQHGLVIAGGSNIRILGGTYSNNGPYGGAGIAITGACEDVQIIGVNLQPSYPGAATVNRQKYALLVSSSPTGAVTVSACDMTGYSGGSPVNVTATQTKLFIIGCPGYNDQDTSIQSTPPTTSPGASASNPGTGGIPYFGPSVIIWSGTVIVTLHVFTQTITSSFGIVFLPSPYDSFYFSGTPTHFSWIGK